MNVVLLVTVVVTGDAVVVAVVVGRIGPSVHPCEIYCCSRCRGRSNVGGDRCSVALVSLVLCVCMYVCTQNR